MPLMWKLLTGIIAEVVYKFLEKNGVLPDEQKGVDVALEVRLHN